MEYDKLKLIQERAEDLLHTLKEDENISAHINAFYILMGLTMASIAFIYIRSDISLRLLIYLLLLIGVIAYHRIRMKTALKENTRLAEYKNENTETKDEHISGLLKYLSSGINVKKTRAETVRTGFMVVFPVFLLLLSEIFFYPFDLTQFIILIVVAFTLGAGFWYVYFTESIKMYEMDKEEVDALLTRLNLE